MFDSNTQSKYDRDVQRVKAEWTQIGFIGFNEFTPEIQRIMDRDLREINSLIIKDEYGRYQNLSYHNLIVYSPSIKSPDREGISLTLRYDSKTEELYSIESFSRAAGGRFFGKGGRVTLYKVKKHGKNLDSALSYAEKAQKENEEYFFKNTTRNQKAEFAEKGLTPFSPYQVFTKQDSPFWGNLDSIKTELAQAVKNAEKFHNLEKEKQEVARSFGII